MTSAKLRSLRALVPHAPRALVQEVPRALRALCLTYLVPYVLSCPTCSDALRTSCPMCSRASCPLCPTCPCALSALCHTCLVSCVASCLTLYDPFFLTYRTVSITLKWRSVFINNMMYLNYLKPNTKTYT